MSLNNFVTKKLNKDRQDKLRQLSVDIGGQYRCVQHIKDNVFAGDKVTFEYKNINITIYDYEVGITTYTKIQAFFTNKDRFNFKIKKTDFLESVKSFFFRNNVKVGLPDLEKKLTIESPDSSKVKDFLSHKNTESTMLLLLEYYKKPSCVLKIVKDKSVTVTTENNTCELYISFATSLSAIPMDRLKQIFELFISVLEQLSVIGTVDFETEKKQNENVYNKENIINIHLSNNNKTKFLHHDKCKKCRGSGVVKKNYLLRFTLLIVSIFLAYYSTLLIESFFIDNRSYTKNTLSQNELQNNKKFREIVHIIDKTMKEKVYIKISDNITNIYKQLVNFFLDNIPKSNRSHTFVAIILALKLLAISSISSIYRKMIFISVRKHIFKIEDKCPGCNGKVEYIKLTGVIGDFIATSIILFLLIKSNIFYVQYYILL